MRHKTNSTSNPEQPKSTGKGKPWESPVDRNHNGRIDLDDVLIFLREAFQWIFSYRGAMVAAAGFTVFAASINIASWSAALAPLGGAAIGAGFLVWAVIQFLELAPILDDLNLNASIAALVRMQRKPLELPAVNTDINPHAQGRYRRYRNRERNQEVAGEFVRYACYGLELAVLVVGGGILSPIGISWSGVLLALVGIVGVEIGIRQANAYGEKLLSQEERDYLKTISENVKRTSVTLDNN